MITLDERWQVSPLVAKTHKTLTWVIERNLGEQGYRINAFWATSENAEKVSRMLNSGFTTPRDLGFRVIRIRD